MHVSPMRTLRIVPTLLRIGFYDALAYRAEVLVWTLATTMPLVMLALWTAVARDAPVGRFGAGQFADYFLVTFLARQLTGTWVAWQINMEIRSGTFGMRLLRPVHPFLAYGAEQVASVPLRLVLSLPMALGMLYVANAHVFHKSLFFYALTAVSVALGWLLTYFTNLWFGMIALFTEQSMKLVNVWVAMYFVLSGYLIPTELFPPWLERINVWLPFRYQIGVPVELFLGRYGEMAALGEVGKQAAMTAAAGVIALLAYRRGLSRFSAVGG